VARLAWRAVLPCRKDEGAELHATVVFARMAHSAGIWVNYRRSGNANTFACNVHLARSGSATVPFSSDPVFPFSPSALRAERKRSPALSSHWFP